MLPQAVRDAVANYDLDKDFDKAMDHADKVFNARKSSNVAAVDLDETAPALQHDVAAVTKKKKFDPKDRQTWGKFHKDFNGKTPSSKICHLHYRWGKQAYSCKAPGVCPWENYTIPKPK